MTLLFHILYAAHTRNTHHKLALDALRRLACMDADLWQNLFLVHGKLYLEGSKAPDNEFKDFRNHVLHTRDGYWGGAPDKARSWYQHTVDALAKQDWPTAAYCAGVLSHYYTDPLQPLHTAQSEAENNVHRAIEWSIWRSYDELYQLGKDEFGKADVALASDANWLAKLVCAGADKANGYYEKLIAHYDITRGVADPPAGLDQVARRIVSEMIHNAVLGFAAILARAIAESRAHAPELSLVGPTLAAAAQTPFKVVGRRIADAQERQLVERMYDELIATGKVEEHLSEDDRAVRDLYAAEVLAKRPPAPEVSKVFPFVPREKVVTRIDQRRLGEPPQEPETSQPRASNVIPLRGRATPAIAAAAEPMEDETTEAGPLRPQRARAGLNDRLDMVTAAPPRKAKEPAAEFGSQDDADRRFHLQLDNDVVDGPAIGPKTAARLYPHGIKTVRDLMKCDPAALAVLVNAKSITADVIADWQDQARLVCTVPGLRGIHAQLLVGAGYRSGEQIAGADAEKLCADVLTFATTTAGQRVLRNGDPPDIEKIKRWLEAAQSVRAA
jgi:predicted flap endonuclease-1-like 5' DNA nuclease